MTVISKIWGKRSDLPENCGIDPLVLTSEERARAHFVAETASGRHVRISLERGAELQDGDVLLIDGNWAVMVSAAEENLLYLKPGNDPVLWWATCYQLGNLHRPVRFLQDGILTQTDPMVLQLLRRLGADVREVCQPFVGRRFGAADHHQHSHNSTGNYGDHKDHDPHTTPSDETVVPHSHSKL